MLAEIRIYYEGDKLLKSGFNQFFSELRNKARAKRCEVILIAARNAPFRDFQKAVQTHPTAWNILLKDSEGPLSAAVCNLDGPADSIYWMVEMMESWFHADKETLARWYGDRFNLNALKQNPNVEEISKKALRDGLSAATKNTGKGDYFDHKASHGSQLLAMIDPDLVCKAAPNCRKLFDAVLAKLAQP